MAAHIENEPENVDEEELVEEPSYRQANLELHRKWVEAKKDRDEANARGDKKAASTAALKISRIGDEVVRANAGLAALAVKPFMGSGRDSSKDYMQAALNGLWEAFLKWDPSTGNSFATFSRFYIRGAVHRTVRSSEYSQMSQTDFTVRSKVPEQTAALQKKLGREPTDAEIAKELGVSAASVKRSGTRSAVSMDKPLGEDGGTLGDVIAEKLVEESLTDQMVELLESRFYLLDDVEVFVMNLRYGLAGGEPLSLVEVADTIGIGREIARRTEKRAIEKLIPSAGGKNIIISEDDDEQ